MNAETYLAALFSPYDGADLRCEIRALAPRGEPCEDRPPRDWWPLTPLSLQAAAKTAVLWSRRWDVYAGVLPRVGRHGGGQDVQLAGWVWVDVDGGEDGPEESIQLLKRSGLPIPHIAVRSGGGVHAYWRLETPVDCSEEAGRRAFKDVLKGIVDKINGISALANKRNPIRDNVKNDLINPERAHADTSAAEVARILRVPDTFNHKRAGQPRPVVMLHRDLSAPAFSFDSWRQSVPLPKPPPPRRDYSDRPAFDPETGISEGLIRWANTGYPEGKRHKDLVSAAAWLLRDQHVPEDVAEALLIIKARVSAGTRAIPEDEIRRMVRWA